ncbi:Gfo/Idh/MocA family oxidoreductase [Rathayibacter sp. VKM Ac-2760]|uniref:Gfo/Idh/MocA family protein n=1 Tax=Rathayibacter sp. VKM Ac-2760 TaxID=2609253 RepID=UPI001318E7ED|nr:Gfo/Idh/MocA family oxidoreductase [Rathayibacter sp. VKM Ac-2760]QHC57696.1 Gfo/Idh/MocA family oxidoreductase [Rathayibacter sp. VKM Ac-2760]
MIPRIGLVGIGGYGASHLGAVLAAHRDGRVRLVGVADPRPPVDGPLPDGVEHHPDAAGLLARGGTDVIIVSTPIHTHAAIALAALEHGNDLLLEKPPAASLAEFSAIVDRAAAAGALVQVGFQSLGSSAIPAIRAAVGGGEIGEVVRYGASGVWVRDDRYWARSPWAGRRTLGGAVVADGVLTNPFAHATATALTLAGADRLEDVVDVRLDLRRANDIESDDTSVAVLTLADGLRVTTAVTLCAERPEEPSVEIVGTRGTLRFYYTLDVVQLEREGLPPRTLQFDRITPFEGLLAARELGTPLQAGIERTGGFMRLLDAVMAAPAPRALPEDAWREVEDVEGRHRVVAGVERALQEALRRETTFAELGLAWS